MASNIKYPEDRVRYFIRGDHIGVISNYDSDGESRTGRKSWQAIDHAITNGMLIHYYGNPKKVNTITDTLDIDNLYHSAIVDYVKKCLYMDKAGTTKDVGMMQGYMSIMAKHERKFEMAVKKYGSKKSPYKGKKTRKKVKI